MDDKESNNNGSKNVRNHLFTESDRKSDEPTDKPKIAKTSSSWDADLRAGLIDSSAELKPVPIKKKQDKLTKSLHQDEIIDLNETEDDGRKIEQAICNEGNESVVIKDEGVVFPQSKPVDNKAIAVINVPEKKPAQNQEVKKVS